MAFLLVGPFQSLLTSQPLLSGAFLLNQFHFSFLARQSYHPQILSASQVGSMGNCYRNTLNFSSLGLSFFGFVLFFSFFFFSTFNKTPGDLSKNRKTKKTNSIIIFVKGREIISQPALLLLHSPRKVLRAEAVSLSGGA